MTEHDDVQIARSKLRHPSHDNRRDPNVFREHRTQRARKQYECDGCDEPILKGQVYDCFVTPAWQDFELDVNDEGRTIAILRDRDERRWQTNRYHPECFDQRYWR